MRVYQPSLWDNAEFQLGIQSLASLRLTDAVDHLTRSLTSPLTDEPLTRRLIQSAIYWRQRIDFTEEPSFDHSTTKKLLGDFCNYDFTAHERPLKKSVLSQISKQASLDSKTDGDIVEKIFDLTARERDFSGAEYFIRAILKNQPEKVRFRYLLAEALWLQGKRRLADNHYSVLLLCYPQELNVNRIRNNALTILIDNYGPGMAVSYGWCRKILEFVSLPGDITIANDQQRTALECYHTLKHAWQSQTGGHQSEIIKYRKALQKLSPDLFTEYYKRLAG